MSIIENKMGQKIKPAPDLKLLINYYKLIIFPWYSFPEKLSL